MSQLDISLDTSLLTLALPLKTQDRAPRPVVPTVGMQRPASLVERAEAGFYLMLLGGFCTAAAHFVMDCLR